MKKTGQTYLKSTKDEVFEVVKKTMRPEFLNRIDELIMFTPLTERRSGKLCRLQFNDVSSVNWLKWE